ncbi:MAG: hypothetical protein M3Z66_02910 [Chloroflexota bacterium]|nr:hypothetical protein [Chloroflexota bacterium]
MVPVLCHNGAMDFRPYIENISHQLALAAEAGGDDARVIAERLVAPLEAALRLALQDVLAAAAEEITCELAPGSVELRLRGRDPEFVVTPPPPDRAIGDLAEGAGDTAPNSWRPADIAPSIPITEGDEGGMSRINFRMPDHLKSRIEHAAGSEGLSVNAWLMRVASAALERNPRDPRREPRASLHGQRYTGWAR